MNISLGKWVQWINIAALTGICLLVMATFFFQIVLHELPCPLCLMQRVGFLGAAFGVLLNLRFGLYPVHYSITLISALYSGFVALRQVALHIIPGSGAYGSALFGLHLYTWSFIISMMIVVYATIILGIDKQYSRSVNRKPAFSKLTAVFFVIVTILVVGNVISLLLECGFTECPDNPVYYKWLR